MFGHTWTSQYGPKPDGIGGDTWAAALSGISGEQLAHGLRETLLLASDFPPSAPRFRALCFGVPSLVSVRAEVMARNVSRSPFCRVVWTHIDPFRFRQADAKSADAMVKEAYEAAREYVMRGGAMPEEPAGEIGLDEPAPIKPASPDVVKSVAAKLREVLGETA